MCSFRMRVRSNAAGLRVSIIHSYRWNVISYVYNRDCNSSKLTHFYTVFQQGYWWYWFLDYWLTNQFININTRNTLTRRDKNTRDDTQSRVMNDLITRRSPTLEKKTIRRTVVRETGTHVILRTFLKLFQHHDSMASMIWTSMKPFHNQYRAEGLTDALDSVSIRALVIFFPVWSSACESVTHK